MNVWQAAINREFVLAYLGVAKDDATIEDATRALSELIQWHVDVATDPKVNGGYVLRKQDDESSTDEPLTEEQLERIRAASSVTGTPDHEFDKRLF